MTQPTQVRIEVEWRGIERLIRATRQLDLSVLRYGKTLVWRAAEEFVNYMLREWSGDYPPSSPPGRPPAVRTGNLDDTVANSLDNARDETGKFAVIGAVYKLYISIDPQRPGGFRRRTVAARGQRRSGFGRRRPYAGYLEWGTSNHSPRPFVRPGLEYVEKVFPQLAGKTTLTSRQGLGR